jgi:hypothetical protein
MAPAWSSGGTRAQRSTGSLAAGETVGSDSVGAGCRGEIEHPDSTVSSAAELATTLHHAIRRRFPVSGQQVTPPTLVA